MILPHSIEATVSENAAARFKGIDFPLSANQKVTIIGTGPSKFMVAVRGHARRFFVDVFELPEESAVSPEEKSSVLQLRRMQEELAETLSLLYKPKTAKSRPKPSEVRATENALAKKALPKPREAKPAVKAPSRHRRRRKQTNNVITQAVKQTTKQVAFKDLLGIPANPGPNPHRGKSSTDALNTRSTHQIYTR